MMTGFFRSLIAATLLAGSIAVAPAQAMPWLLYAIPLMPVMRMPAEVGGAVDSGVSGASGPASPGSAANSASGAGPEAARAPKPALDGFMISDTELPAGAKFQVSKDALGKAKRIEYWDGEQVREEEFVPIGKIDPRSLPASWQDDLRSRDGQGTRLYAPRSAIQEAPPAGGEYTAPKPTRVYYDDGPRAVPLSPQDRRAQTDSEWKNTARRAADLGSEVHDSGISSPGCGGSQASANDGKFLPARALKKAMEAFQRFGSRIRNKRFIAINDFTAPSSEPRMFIVDPQTGQVVKRIHVAHGSGVGQAANAGRTATNFGNAPSSNLTPPGFLLTGEVYRGKHGQSLRMDGLEARNSNTRSRAVVIHGSDYVNPAIARARGAVGRSWGCAAIAQNEVPDVIEKMRGGALVYNFTPADDR